MRERENSRDFLIFVSPFSIKVEGIYNYLVFYLDKSKNGIFDIRMHYSKIIHVFYHRQSKQTHFLHIFQKSNYQNRQKEVEISTFSVFKNNTKKTYPELYIFCLLVIWVVK